MAAPNSSGAAAPGLVTPESDEAAWQGGPEGAVEKCESLVCADTDTDAERKAVAALTALFALYGGHQVRKLAGGGFYRDRLPDWQSYANQFGYSLVGSGSWRTTRCDLHGGSDSLRVNVEKGAWVCMACGAKGGDVLAHHMAITGAPFVEAARALGAWDEAAAPAAAQPRPRRFSASDALSVLASEVAVCTIVIADARRGLTPNDADWQRFLQAAGRIDLIASEVRS